MATSVDPEEVRTGIQAIVMDMIDAVTKEKQNTSSSRHLDSGVNEQKKQNTSSSRHLDSGVNEQKKVWKPFFYKCESLKLFEEVLQNSYKMYKCLKPGGKILQINNDGDETVQEYFRGVVISLLATWEEFLLSIMREAYDILINSTPTLHTLREIWPQCEELIKNTIERRGKPAEDAFKILMEEISWKSLLEDHRDHILDTRLVPVFRHGNKGINKLFATLFQFKEATPNPPLQSRRASNSSIQLANISLTIVQQFNGIKYEYPGKNESTLKCELTSMEAINDPVRLYYGARCIFAHGNATLTFQENGVLHTPVPATKPTNDNSSDFTKELSILYKKLKEDKRKAIIAYSDLTAMFQYFRRIARRIMIAIATEVQRCTKRKCDLWGINEILPILPDGDLIWVARKRALERLEKEEDEQAS